MRCTYFGCAYPNNPEYNHDHPVLVYIIGWLCPSMPDGPMVPAGRLVDPCGEDVPVWSDGSLGWQND
jgi:hypothetical protein